MRDSRQREVPSQPDDGADLRGRDERSGALDANRWRRPRPSSLVEQEVEEVYEWKKMKVSLT